MTAPSTTAASPGYYQPGAVLRLSRLAFTASQSLWPALAVRVAARLFCTPLPPKWLQRGGRWEAGWTHEHWPFEDADLTLHAATVDGEAPVALLVHGWGGHARQLLPLAKVLAAQGWQPVLLEMPGHGASAGSTGSLPQFSRAIEYVVHRLQQQGRAVGVLAAHSLGANAAAHAASRGLGVARLVLLAPPASPRGYTRYFAQVFGLREATRAAMQQRIEAREGVLMQQFEPRFVAPRIAVPTLVVHDRGDRVNAFADGEAYANAIRDARLLATEGLGHRRLLNDDAVVAQVAAFCAREGVSPVSLHGPAIAPSIARPDQRGEREDGDVRVDAAAGIGAAARGRDRAG